MSLAHFQPDLLDALESQLSDALRTVSFIRSLVATQQSNPKPSPCNLYPDKHTCTQLCDQVPKDLPKVNKGRGRSENLTGLHLATLQKTERIRLSDVFDKYESCKEIFTLKQWEVIYLYYGQGMTHQQIADKLGQKRPAISNRLSRAKERMRCYQAQLRRERADYERRIRGI